MTSGSCRPFVDTKAARRLCAIVYLTDGISTADELLRSRISTLSRLVCHEKESDLTPDASVLAGVAGGAGLPRGGIWE